MGDWQGLPCAGWTTGQGPRNRVARSEAPAGGKGFDDCPGSFQEDEFIGADEGLRKGLETFLWTGMHREGVHEIVGCLNFLFLSRSLVDLDIQAMNSFIGITSSIINGEFFCSLHYKRAVHHVQGLLGSGRSTAVAFHHVGVGEVEKLEQVIDMITDDGEVEGSPVDLITGVVLGCVVENELAVLKVPCAAAEGGIESVTDPEKGIPERLSLDPADGGP